MNMFESGTVQELRAALAENAQLRAALLPFARLAEPDLDACMFCGMEPAGRWPEDGLRHREACPVLNAARLVSLTRKASS